MNPLAWGWAARESRWTSRSLGALSIKCRSICSSNSKEACFCGLYSLISGGLNHVSPDCFWDSCQLAEKAPMACSTVLRRPNPPSFGVRAAWANV